MALLLKVDILHMLITKLQMLQQDQFMTIVVLFHLFMKMWNIIIALIMTNQLIGVQPKPILMALIANGKIVMKIAVTF